MPQKKATPLTDAISVWSNTRLWPKGIKVPVVQLIGEPNTGKSTFFAAMRDLGEDVTITAFDMEGSMVNLADEYNIEVIDIRQKVFDKFNNGEPMFEYTNGQLFECWLEAVEEHPGADICIHDTISRVFLGANEWTIKHPALFNKEAQNYWGDGKVYSWGDTNNLLWPNIVEMLKRKFRLVAFLSHMKDIYIKTTNSKGKEIAVKSGKRTQRGTDFSDMCTLVIELCRDPDDPTIPVNKLNSGTHGGFYGIVRKDRILHRITVTKKDLAEQRGCSEEEIDDFDPKLGAHNASLLPKRLIPAPMQAYHRLIYGYMIKPQLDYGELNRLVYDPAEMPEEERRAEADALALEKTETDLRKLTEERKKEFRASLVNAGLYADGLAIAEALRELNLAYSLEQHDEILAALIAHAKKNGNV